MKFREVRSRLRQGGWQLVRQSGSHEQWKHPEKQGRVTLAGKDGDDIPAGTLRAIFQQADWAWEK